MQDDPLIGSNLGQYEIVEMIGRGGMATVYRAYHPPLDRYVALKVLPAYFAHDPDFSERFKREARAVARLEHPNILQVYDFGEQDHVSYIVMSLVTGGTLKDRIGDPLPLDWSLRVCAQVADALDYAHQNGIVHRDVKPSNILLGPGDRAFLADFGIAKMADASRALTRTGLGVGTPEYLSPEQAQGSPLDGRSDLYSLATMLYEMLAGTVPFQGDSAFVVIFKHLNEPVPSLRAANPNVPPAVEMIIRKALAKHQDERFDTAGEFVGALLRVGQGSPAPEQPAPAPAAIRIPAADNTLLDGADGRPAAAMNPPGDEPAMAQEPTPAVPEEGDATLARPTLVVTRQRPARRTLARPSPTLVMGAMAGVIVLLFGLVVLLRGWGPLTAASPAGAPTALVLENTADASATAEAQVAIADATRTAAEADATATAEVAATAMAALIQATVQAELGVVLEATAQVAAAAGTATALAELANPTATQRPATPTARPANPPAVPTTAPPVLPPAATPAQPRLPARVAIDITGADCRGVTGSVSINTPQGAQPLRDYVVKGGLINPDGTTRLFWDNLAVEGPRFQLEFPIRLLPRPNHNVMIQVTKPGIVGASATTRHTFACT